MNQTKHEKDTQKNKQTNKQIFSSLSNQVQYLQNFQKTPIWVSQDNSSKKAIMTTKQANKETNNHLLDPQYLSQIKSDLNETSCQYPKMIQVQTQTNEQ